MFVFFCFFLDSKCQLKTYKLLRSPCDIYPHRRKKKYDWASLSFSYFKNHFYNCLTKVSLKSGAAGTWLICSQAKEHQPHQSTGSALYSVRKGMGNSQHTHTYRQALSLSPPPVCVKQVHLKVRQNITLAQLHTHCLRSNGSLAFTLAIEKRHTNDFIFSFKEVTNQHDLSPSASNPFLCLQVCKRSGFRLQPSLLSIWRCFDTNIELRSVW